MRNFVASLLLFCSVSVFAQSQPATIYFNDGTSIEGFGEIKLKGIGFYKKNVIEFRASIDDKPDEWDESIVKGITFVDFEDTHKFEYIVPGKREDPVLVELLTEGNVTLYIDRVKVVTHVERPKTDTLMDNFNVRIEEKDYVYVKKASEEYPTLLNGNYKKKAMLYFNDCEALVQRIQDNKYSWKTIQDVVEFYNDYCVE